jgi:mannan endo-1,4-beta-mannosidase
MKTRHIGQLATAVIVLAVVSLLGLYLTTRGGRASHAAPTASPQGTMSRGTTAQPTGCGEVPARPLLGVAVKTPLSQNVEAVAKTVGMSFKLVEVYDAFGTSPFLRGEAEQATELHAVPVIQLNARTVPLREIVAGKYDTYLQKYTDAVRRFGCRVILSFGHEMNGYWYPWGCRHTKASVFIQAWRHIVTVMRPARNITWMWTVNVDGRGDCPLLSRWPGARYVNWIGVDGYLRKPGVTFRDIFGKTLTQLRQLHKPVLISEAGALAGPGQGQRILDIYRGAVRTRVLGVIYFDNATAKYGDYRPQDSPAALSDFREALQDFDAAHPTTATRENPQTHGTAHATPSPSSSS